jgi:putative colanic acid biosynthesis glycosyltransferase
MSNNATPLQFTIITITRNDLAGLQRTEGSIAGQTFRDFEWIVIDGNSSDGTGKYLGSLHRPNFSWLSEPDRGIFDAMNKGLDRANGRYVIFMNSGDKFAGPEILARLFELVSRSNKEWDLVFGDAYEETDDGRLLLKRSRSVGAVRYGMFTHHQAMFYSRKAIANERFDLRFRVAADYHFTSRLLANGGSSFRVTFPICTWMRAGFSEHNAAIGRRENLEIQRDVLRLGRLRRASNYAFFLASNLFRTHMRSLYDRIRFHQPASAA